MARKRGLRALPAFNAEGGGIPEEDRALIQRRVQAHVARRPWRLVHFLAYRFGGWLVSVGERLQLWAE